MSLMEWIKYILKECKENPLNALMWAFFLLVLLYGPIRVM